MENQMTRKRPTMNHRSTYSGGGLIPTSTPSFPGSTSARSHRRYREEHTTICWQGNSINSFTLMLRRSIICWSVRRENQWRENLFSSKNMRHDSASFKGSLIWASACMCSTASFRVMSGFCTNFKKHTSKTNTAS